MPVKPLSFKGDKKSSKKRKAAALSDPCNANPPSTALSPYSPALSKPNSTDPTASAEDDTWVTAEDPTDLTGPIIFVLPTALTPSALACDGTGAVFVSPLENVFEGDPATAEPHDVRQVWIATQIPGAKSGEVVVSFKGSNGRYLGCDRRGFLRAEAVAVGVGEGFRVDGADLEGDEGKGRFLVVTGGGEKENGEEEKQKYVCVEEPAENGKKGWEVRGDGERVKENSMLRIRMQARFKPRLKANKEMKAKEKISRRELETAVGRKLEDDEVKRLKRARRNGTYHEEVLDVRVKGKHDKFAS
jgi:protein FRG1